MRDQRRGISDLEPTTGIRSGSSIIIMSSQVCHGMHNGVIQNIQADLPCGVTNSSHPYVTCCVNGDYCLSNSICVNTNDKDGDYYYAADCTDETLTDPACGTRCGEIQLIYLIS